jgi:hypothetical protein
MLRSAFQRRFACARVIRVCAFHKQCIFGRVVEDHMNENDCGKIAREQRLESAQIRQEFALDAFIVMPNHLHGILWILGAKGGRVLVNGGFGQPIAGADGVRPPDAKTPVGASRARPLAEPRSPFGRAALALWPSRARPLAEPRSPFGRAALAPWPSRARPLAEPRSPLGRAPLGPTNPAEPAASHPGHAPPFVGLLGGGVQIGGYESDSKALGSTARRGVARGLFRTYHSRRG